MVDKPKREDDSSTIPETPDVILPHPVDGSGSLEDDRAFPPVGGGRRTETVEEQDVPGAQRRTMTDDEKLDKSLEDTFPTSDPIAPSRVDGPARKGDRKR